MVNEEFLEAASTMSEADPVNYSLVKEFVVLHVEFNNLKMYAAEKLVANGSSLVDTSNTIPKFIKQEFRALPDGNLIRAEEDELSSDVHYKKLNNSLEYFKRFYLFGFKLEGSERERWNEFAKAREIFNTYIEKTKNAPAVQAAFSKNFKEVCKL